MPTLDATFRRSGSRVRPHARGTGSGGGGAGFYPTDATIVTHADTIPNFARTPTIRAVATGNWSAAGTWDLGRAPQAGDVVAIPTTFTVTYDVNSSAAIAAVGVAGTLRFRTDIVTKLAVTNFLIYGPEVLGVLGYGYLEIGTAATPVDAAVTATVEFNDVAIDIGTLDALGTDPKQYGTGFIMHGKCRIHGAPKTNAWQRLAAEPLALDAALTLSLSVTGWSTGDLLVVPDSRQLDAAHAGEDAIWSNYVPHWETRTVSGISGTTVNLNSALSHDHFGGEHGYGANATTPSDFYPHVANLTRNVIFKSANGAGTRGHTFWTNRADFDVRWARFTEMGRTTNGQLSSYWSISPSQILAIQNTTPRLVQLFVSVDFATSDQVKITGSGGVVDGTWTITRASLEDNTLFYLNGSTAGAPYTGGATILHLGSNQIGRYNYHVHHEIGLTTGGLSYDAAVDPPEFQPGNPANSFLPAGRTCDGASWRVVGCVFDDPNPAPPSNALPASKWAFTIHASHLGLVKSCIFHHYAGSGVMFEDGSESFNVVEDCLADTNIGDTDPRRVDGRSGAGMFFSGFNNWIRRNVAAGNAGKYAGIVSGSGYEYFTVAATSGNVRNNPRFQGADTEMGIEGTDYDVVNAQQQAIRQFDDNEACGVSAGGMVLWNIGTDGYSTFASQPTSTLRRFKVWNVWENGIYLYPAVNCVFDGWIIRGDPNRLDAASPMHAYETGDYWTTGITLTNWDVRGTYDGVADVRSMHGPGTALTVSDSRFQCYGADVYIQTTYTPGTGAGATDHSDYAIHLDNNVYAQWGALGGFYKISRVYTAEGYLRVKQSVFVTDFDGTPGDDFQLYYNEQVSTQVMPQDGTGSVVEGCPVAGLTNAQAYVAYHQSGAPKSGGSLSDPEGCCIGGEIAPGGATTRSGVYGLVF